MNARMKYDEWLGRLDPRDPMYEELLTIRGNEAEITDRFYQEIVFGTAGLRGICGAGTNRMNRMTVGRATQGIADYIKASGEDPARGVAFAYDCRYHSQEFSELAARIIAANGIRAYLFPSLRPTPELSFTIRELGCVAGINMTASHNPKEYNGYKVYWKDGAQISGSVSDGILERIQSYDLFHRFQEMPMEEAVEKGLIVMLNVAADGTDYTYARRRGAAAQVSCEMSCKTSCEAQTSETVQDGMPADGENGFIDMDRRFLDYVESQSLRDASELDLTVPIVYTPLNGAGSVPMQVVAAERGFTNCHIVPEQRDPDPEFTTVGYPNPEDAKAFELSERLGKEIDAQILIATDPDSDRMAIEVPDGKGGYLPLNGNQTGALIIAYKAMSMTELGIMPEKPVMIKSIVTGDLGRAICESYGIDVYEALTGFKNICGRIPELQDKGYTYFMGYEESIGCAPGERIRDKDGIAAGMLLMEMTAYYARKGMSVLDVLNSLYERYGYYAEKSVNLILKGQEGSARIARIMAAVRTGSIAGLDVAQRIDYIDGYEDIPAQNALKFVLTDGTWFALRPSGTEPKLKFYYYTISKDSYDAALARLDEVNERMMAMVESVE